MLDSQVGAYVIDADHSGGSNPREGETFAALEAQISKLTELNASGMPDWKIVSQLATDILRQQGKDLSVAVWLVTGWAHSAGTGGLVAGLRVLRDVHVLHWETMTPPVQRLRGRRNQMEWLLHHLEKILIDTDRVWDALSSQQHAQVLSDWDDIDQVWQSADNQAPAMVKVRRLLDDLQVSPEVPEQHQTESQVDMVNDAAADATVLDGLVDQPESVPEASAQASPRPVSAALPSSEQEPAKTQDAEVAADANADTDPIHDAAIERMVGQRLDAIRLAVAELPDQALYLPMLYRLNRVCAWMVLDAAPPHADGVTRIPPPAQADQDILDRLLAANDAQALLRFAESRLVAHRFWLDLNRIAHAAALTLPQGQAIAGAIADETANMLKRMPELMQLRFMDNQPFADDATRLWLDTIQAVAVPVSVAQMSPSVTARQGGFASGKPYGIAEPTDAMGLVALLAAASAEAQAAGQLLDAVVSRLQAGSSQFIRPL